MLEVLAIMLTNECFFIALLHTPADTSATCVVSIKIVCEIEFNPIAIINFSYTDIQSLS